MTDFVIPKGPIAFDNGTVSDPTGRPLTQLEALTEGARIMAVCNSCRYCEGYCAVFPAMERRLDFASADLNYLANLCHNCGECYYACQFSPPHEFAVNVPATMAQIRTRSYEQYAWPGPLAGLFQKGGGYAASAVVAALLVFFWLGLTLFGESGLFSYQGGDGNFYKLMPHSLMVNMFGVVSLFVLVAFVIGFTRFWRDSGESLAEFAKPFALKEALSDVLTMKYLSSGGRGCTYPDEKHSLARRAAHQMTMYGFFLCFAATSVGTLYHYVFGWMAPYAFFSLPVLLGTAGGIGLVLGPATLLFLKGRQDAATKATSQAPMDLAFIWLLLATSATGLLLLVLRGTPWLGFWLVVHLAIVMALFLTLPYGKFVHGIYRGAALVKYALERRRPNSNIGGE